MKGQKFGLPFLSWLQVAQLILQVPFDHLVSVCNTHLLRLYPTVQLDGGVDWNDLEMKSPIITPYNLQDLFTEVAFSKEEMECISAEVICSQR